MTILVPTDFSRNAMTAVVYAAKLIKYIGGSMRLLHVTTPYASKTTYLKVESAELRQITSRQLCEVRDLVARDYGVECSCTVASGDVPEKILEAALDPDVSMIIMGSNKKRYFLFGSVTTSIVEKCSVPVLVLPKGMEFEPYRKIVFATDYQPHDLQDLKELTSIAGKFDCPLHVVHVVNRFEEDEDEVDLSVMNTFSEMIERHVSYPRIKCEEYQYVDVPEGIQSYAEEEQADLLVVSTRQRKFIQRLFGRSVTRELLFDFNHPLLIYHAKETAEASPLTTSTVNYELKYT